MKEIDYIIENENLMKNFIKNNILNNNYYENIKKIYENANNDEKTTIILEILDCFENFNSYYSLYTIMDSIEDCLNEHKNIKSIQDIIESDYFTIKETY